MKKWERTPTTLRNGDFARIKRDTLVNELGGKCACKGADCWHEGECTVAYPKCLQLDHIYGDGAADRKRLNGVGTVGYYSMHLVEARERLQVLCANCNWVKRHNNDEVKNGERVRVKQRIPPEWLEERRAKKRAQVMSRLTGIPEYIRLVELFHCMHEAIIRATEFDLINGLTRHGIEDSRHRPMAHHLTKKWEQQTYFKDNVEDLTSFVQEKHREIEITAELLARRIGKSHLRG